MNENTSILQGTLYPPRNAPRGVRNFLLASMVIGLLSFLIGLLSSPERTWQAYFVNFLFWSGLAQGGVIMAAVYRITNARWGDQFRRVGEGMVSFLPVSLLLYLVLIVGGNSVFPWMHHEVPGKETWLNPYFLFGRDGLAFVILLYVSYRFVFHSIRPDIGLMKEAGCEIDRQIAPVIVGWKGWAEEAVESKKRLAVLTPVLLICFGTLYTLLGFDLVMALDPHWYSTLFGWMYFLHAFYASLAAITILTYFAMRWFHLEAAFQTPQWHDMGRFLFGFALLSGGFFWSQFLVIWYGNLPEETSFLIKRFYERPWEPAMWTFIIVAYILPLVVFLSARIKQIPWALSIVAGVIFAALFIERIVTVVPFIWDEATIPLGFQELGLTLGFLGLFLWCWLAFARFVPVVPPRPVSEPEGEHRAESLPASA